MPSQDCDELATNERYRLVVDMIRQGGERGVSRKQIFEQLGVEKKWKWTFEQLDGKKPDGTKQRIPYSTLNLLLRDLRNYNCVKTFRLTGSTEVCYLWSSPELEFREASKADRFLVELYHIQVDIRSRDRRGTNHICTLEKIVNQSGQNQHRYPIWWWSDKVSESWYEMNPIVYILENDGSKTKIHDRNSPPEFFHGHDEAYGHYFWADFKRDLEDGEKLSLMAEYDTRDVEKNFTRRKITERKLVFEVITREKGKRILRYEMRDYYTKRLLDSKERRDARTRVVDLLTGRKVYALSQELNYPAFSSNVIFKYEC